MTDGISFVPEILAVKEDKSDMPMRRERQNTSDDILAVYLSGGPRYQLNNQIYHFTPPIAILISKGTFDADLQEGKVDGIFVLFSGNGMLRGKDHSETEVIVSLGADWLAVPVLKEISSSDADKLKGCLAEISATPGAGLTSQMHKISLLYQAIAIYCGISGRSGGNVMHREAYKLRELIHGMALERCSMEEIYKELSLSSSHAETLFRKAYGITPVAYRMQIRLNRARELLVTTQYNVSQVAYSVGFTDPLYFSRLFRNAFGTNPSSLIADYGFSRNKGMMP